MRKRGKFLYKIMFSIITLVVAILAVSFFTLYFFSLDNAKKTSLNFTERVIRQVDRSVNNYVGNMNGIFDAVTGDELIFSYFTDPSADREEIGKKLDFIVSTRKDITNIFLLASEDFSVGMDAISNEKDAEINPYNNYWKSTWYDRLFNEGREVVFTSSYVQNLIKGRYEWVISLGKKVYEEDKLLGVILIDLRYSSIISLCTDVMPSNSGYVFILDDRGSIVYHPRQQLIYSNLMTEQTGLVASLGEGESAEREGKLYLSSNIRDTNWRVAGVIEIDALLSEQRNLVWYFVVTALVFGLLACAISFFISKRITKPILNLERTVKKVREGDLSAKADPSSNDEVGDLSESFNEMTDRIAELMEKFEKEQIEKRESVLWALKAQINPHFLYNTLDSIVWMAEAGQNEDVVEMTSALAKMLRASIGRDSETATLRLELENIRNYLRIQKYRYKSKLNYEIDVPEKLYNRRVEHLSLQPLVENAIYHGIRERREGGLITVFAEERDGNLVIAVEDNGVGMTEERIREIMNREESVKSMGVRNVDNRIKLTFGSEYGLKIESKPGVGTRVTMTLPDLEVKNENA